MFLNAGRCNFEWIGLHFKAIFRRLSGFERPENAPVESFPRERAGRPVDRWAGRKAGSEEVGLLGERAQTDDTAGGPTSSDPALRPAHLSTGLLAPSR